PAQIYIRRSTETRYGWGGTGMNIKGESDVDEFAACYRWTLIRWECSTLPGSVAAGVGALFPAPTASRAPLAPSRLAIRRARRRADRASGGDLSDRCREAPLCDLGRHGGRNRAGDKA